MCLLFITFDGIVLLLLLLFGGKLCFGFWFELNSGGWFVERLLLKWRVGDENPDNCLLDDDDEWLLVKWEVGDSVDGTGDM